MTSNISIYPVEKLSKHVFIKPGFAFQSEQFSGDTDDIPLVKGENVHQGYIDWSASKYWSRNDVGIFDEYWLELNDVVIAMDRPWVNAGLKWSYIKNGDPRALLVQRVARLRVKPSLDQIYLRYLIGSNYFENYIKPIVTGVNIPHISAKQIGDFKTPIPSLPTQQKIAAILSAYDDLIENNNRRIALLEKAAEEIYREWFVRMRFPGWQQSHFVKGVPDGWEIVGLEKIAKFTMGQSPKSEFYNETGDGLPFHQGVGTYGERFPENKIYCSVAGRMAKKGDILFSVRAPVGRINIANCDLIIGRGLAAIRHKDNKNSYLFYLLQNQFAKEDVIGNGAIFASVSKDELLRFKILSPSKRLIEKFDDMVSKIDQQIENIYAVNAKLKQSRDLLLPRLISGKLSVEELDIHFPPGMSTSR